MACLDSLREGLPIGGVRPPADHVEIGISSELLDTPYHFMNRSRECDSFQNRLHRLGGRLSSGQVAEPQRIKEGSAVVTAPQELRYPVPHDGLCGLAVLGHADVHAPTLA